MPIRPSLLPSLVVLCQLAFASLRAAPTVPLGDALVALPAERDLGFGLQQLALAAEFGVAAERVHAKVPGLKWAAVSAPLRAIFSHREALGEQLLTCLDDTRETKLSSAEMFGEGPKLKVRDAAASLMTFLASGPLDPTAAEALGKLSEAEAEKVALQKLREWFAAYLARVKGLPRAQRVELWLRSANGLALERGTAAILFWGDEELGPLLEAALMEKLKNPETAPILESLAYVRQRKAAAQPFWEKLRLSPYFTKPVTAPDPDSKGFLDEMLCARENVCYLTRPDGLRELLDGFRQGTVPVEMLERFCIRSVDLYWDYHSTGVEPTVMHLSTAWQNLVRLTTAAAQMEHPAQRVQLLRAASGAADVYRNVSLNTWSIYLKQPEPTEWADSRANGLRDQLQKILQQSPDCRGAGELLEIARILDSKLKLP